VPAVPVLAGGLFLVLLLASETSLWNRHLGLALALAALALLLFCVWAAVERRAKSPLVDVRLVRYRAVAGAYVAMLVGGAPLLLAGSAIVVLAGFVLFALDRSNLTELLVSMAILGFGVGSFSAAMPAVILAVTPKSETSSAMSFNQVVRSVGFSFGSAVGGLVLAAGTDTGHLFPTDGAYTTAALIGIAAMAVSAMTSIALARQHASKTEPTTAPTITRPEGQGGSSQ